MFKTIQIMAFVLGLGFLTACETVDNSDAPYGMERTAGGPTSYEMGGESNVVYNDNMDAELKMCMEKEARLKAMNKNCYRK
jgi:hypothetical protein